MYTSLNIEFSWLCFIFMATIDDQCVMRLQHNQRVPPIKCICMWNKHLNCVKNRKWKWKVLPYPGFFLWTLPIKINLSNMERATSFYFFFLFFFSFYKKGDILYPLVSSYYCGRAPCHRAQHLVPQRAHEMV